MKKKILCILIVISVFICMLLYTQFTPGGSIRTIVTVTLLSGLIAKKVYDDKFTKIDAIMLLSGVLFLVIIFFYFGGYRYL